MKPQPTTPNPEIAECLARARKAIEEAAALLDRRSQPCASCGLTVREHFHEFQLGTILDAMADRLERYEKPFRDPKARLTV